MGLRAHGHAVSVAATRDEDGLMTLTHTYQQIEGGFWFRNAYDRLLDALPTDRPSVWVEVGVFHGCSLAWLGVETVNRGMPLTIHGVDSFAGWPGVAQGDLLRASFWANITPVAEALGDRFHVHDCPSVDAATRFPDASLDVVWIDADHSYEGAKADIAAWLPKVRAGGVIGGDDMPFPGVAKAVREAFGTRAMIGEGDREGLPWPWWMVRC